MGDGTEIAISFMSRTSAVPLFLSGFQMTFEMSLSKPLQPTQVSEQTLSKTKQGKKTKTQSQRKKSRTLRTMTLKMSLSKLLQPTQVSEYTLVREQMANLLILAWTRVLQVVNIILNFRLSRFVKVLEKLMSKS